MNEAYEKHYLELDSSDQLKQKLSQQSKMTPSRWKKTSFETCRQEAVKKRQASADLENACQRDVVFLRRMSAIAIVALLTAAAALFLAISAMKGEHNSAHSYEVAKFHQ